MSKPDTWMPLYIGDYLRDTSRLSTEQHGAYLLLIMDYWSNGPPPDDDAILCQITKLQAGSWAASRPALARLFAIEGGYWRHKRVDEEIVKATAFLDKQTNNGRKGGRPAKEKPPETQTKPMGFDRLNPNHNPNETPSPSPTPEALKSKTKPDAAKAARFDPLSLDLGEVPADKWGEWIAYRRNRKLSNAEPTMRAQVDNLNAWLQKGHAPAEVIAKSIANGWQGLFEPKEGGAGPPRSQFISHADQSKLAAARAIFGTEIEANHGTNNGRTIDITPASRQVGQQNIPGATGQLRLAVPEPVEDWASTG